MTPSQLQQAQKARQAFQQGRFSAVFKIARSVLKTTPDQSYFANLAGIAMVQLGDPKAAIPYFSAAMRGDTDMAEARSNLAQALIQSGDANKALVVLEKALVKWPAQSTFEHLRASAFHALDDAEKTITAATDALRNAPRNGALYNLRALAHQRLGDTGAAGVDFQAAVAASPTDAEARNNYATFLAYHARSTEAFDQLDAGLKAQPTHTGLLLRKASLLQATGNMTQAREIYVGLLDRQPDHPLALNGLAYVSSKEDAGGLQTRISKILRSTKIGRDEKVLLKFARAQLAHDCDDVDAQRLLVEANAAAAKAIPYSAVDDEQEQAALMAPFVQGAFHANPMAVSPAPIFITGLIRSGTTLTEQILASHPNVHGLGELTAARILADRQARAYAAGETRFDGGAFASAYRAGLPILPDGITHFVDKMPDNFRVIGALAAAFPNATLIEIRRDPRDVALSMWRSFFPTTALSYSNDFGAMADHMNMYARVLETWRALFSNRIKTIHYKEITANLDVTTRHLAEICNLDWHSAMLHPERSGNIILTASDSQVRAPVHGKSVGKWRLHATLLAPLIDRLDPELWPEIQQG